nr:MAG TPA: hypothetical protein [Caudoviricetes sp.]
MKSGKGKLYIGHSAAEEGDRCWCAEYARGYASFPR